MTLLAVLGYLALDAPSVGAQTPTLLPPLPGDTSSLALAINNRGEVAGESESFFESGPIRAVVWDHK
jgi:hypothetical protein